MYQKEFYLRALEEGVRVSRRGFQERRCLKIAFPADYGQVIVELGDTLVVGQVTGEIIVPPPERPSEGIISIHTQISANACADALMYNPTGGVAGGSTSTATQISYILERLIKSARVIDPESLCILAGKRVWSLRINIRISADAGNVVDAAGIAALSALIHYRRRDVQVEGKSDIKVFSPEERSQVPLPLLHHPILVSFVVVKLKSASARAQPIILMDPDNHEECVFNSMVTIAANAAGEICLVHKGGGPAIPHTLLNQCVELIKGHVIQVSQVITDALNEDAAARSRRRGRSIHLASCFEVPVIR